MKQQAVLVVEDDHCVRGHVLLALENEGDRIDQAPRGQVKRKSGSRVDGGVTACAAIPPVTQVGFGVSASGSDVPVPRGQTQSLAPGMYMLLKVEEDATLILSGGGTIPSRRSRCIRAVA